MKLRIRGQVDFLAGLLFISIGIFAIIVAREYHMGKPMNMGPGFFPTYIGLGLVSLGGLIAASGLIFEGGKVGAFSNRPLLILCGALVYFGWIIERMGIVPALAGLVVLSALAGKDFRLKEVSIMTALLIFGAWFVFIYLLGMPYPLW